MPTVSAQRSLDDRPRLLLRLMWFRGLSEVKNVSSGGVNTSLTLPASRDSEDNARLTLELVESMLVTLPSSVILGARIR